MNNLQNPLHGQLPVELAEDGYSTFGCSIESAEDANFRRDIFSVLCSVVN